MTTPLKKYLDALEPGSIVDVADGYRSQVPRRYRVAKRTLQHGGSLILEHPGGARRRFDARTGTERGDCADPWAGRGRILAPDEARRMRDAARKESVARLEKEAVAGAKPLIAWLRAVGEEAQARQVLALLPEAARAKAWGKWKGKGK